MLPDDVLGLPLHPLIVHAAVVLVPLAAVGTLLITVVPRWRRTYGWLVVIASGAALVTVPLATRTGRRLTELREFGGPVLERIQEHEIMGDRIIWAVAPMFVLNVAVVMLLRAGRPSRDVTVIAMLATVAAAVSVVLVVLTGHLGSTAVWNPTG